MEVPGTAGRVEASGWLDGRAVVATEASPLQRPGAQGALQLDGAWGRSLAAHLEVRGRIGGPFVGGHQGVYDLSHAFQNYSPALEWNEAYVDARLSRADLRVGIQRFAWGKLDGLPPTDVLNPRDFHDPLVQDVEERKIGVPAAAGTWYAPDLPRLALSQLRATLVWVPFAVPSRLALIEERWFPSSLDVPSVFRVPVEGVGRVAVPVSFATRNDRPPRRLEDGAVALRLGGTWRQSDWALYHYTGPETAPNAALRVEAIASGAPPGVRIASQLRQADSAMHMTGADWSTVLGGATVRAEAAVFQDRPYLRLSSDLVREATPGPRQATRILQRVQRRGRAPIPVPDLFPPLDAVEWGVGADYLVRGFQPLLQVTQIALLEDAPRLLIGDPETRVAAVLRRRWLADRLETEVRGIYAIERGGWFLLPRVSYLVRDDLRVRVGYLAIGGPRTHLIGQFGGNDEVVFEGRYSF